MNSRADRKVNILGVGISAVSMKGAVSKIRAWIESDARVYVSVCTVHTVMECQEDPQMHQAVNGASMATPDGMPLAWLGKSMSDGNVTRVYGPDLVYELCKLSEETGFTHYLYGGKEGVPEEFTEALQEIFPKLQVVGGYSPPFRKLSEAETADIHNTINAANPDIIWVGLGTPKQDLWMAENRDALNARVLIGVGAAFDFYTGRVKQAPTWMQRNGLEWLFRLMVEPRRLWYRYLVYNPKFIFNIILQRLNLRQFSPLSPEKQRI